MATSWREQKILCPFFRKEDARKHIITCEGLGDALSISWNFNPENERQRIERMEIFCQDRYASCELYRWIWESKYDD